MEQHAKLLKWNTKPYQRNIQPEQNIKLQENTKFQQSTQSYEQNIEDDQYNSLPPLLLTRAAIVERDFIFKYAALKQTDAAFVDRSWVEENDNSCTKLVVNVICVRRRIVKEIYFDNHTRVIGDEGIVWTQADRTQEVRRIHAVIPETSLKIDIIYSTWDAMHQLALAVQRLHDAAKYNVFMVPAPLSLPDSAIIHQLYHATDIVGEAYLRHLRREIGRQRFLYLMYRCVAVADPILADLLVAWNQRAWDRSVELVRYYVTIQFQAYTYLLGNTHYHRQWMLPYAQQCGVEKNLLARFVQITLCQELACVNTKRAFILSSLDFVDSVLAAGAVALRWLSGFSSREVAQHVLTAQFKTYGSAYSEQEVMYRFKAYGLESRPLRLWFARGAD